MPVLMLLVVCVLIVVFAARVFRRRDSAVDPLDNRAHLDAEAHRYGKGDAASGGG